MFCFVLKKELNARDGAWDKICTERDPFILCSLMWSWIEQLKEPIISKDDVDMLAQKCTESQEALYLLRKVDLSINSLTAKYILLMHVKLFIYGLQTRGLHLTSISFKIRMKIIVVSKSVSFNQYYDD